MLISPSQNTISFNANFRINPSAKPKNQRTHYSAITKLENRLSKALEAATRDDKNSRLIFSSIDFAAKKLRFKLLQSNGKTIVKDSIDITNPKNPFSDLTEENITKIYNKLKEDTDKKWGPSFKNTRKADDHIDYSTTDSDFEDDFF